MRCLNFRNWSRILENINRIGSILEEVSFIDDSLRVVNCEYYFFGVIAADMVEKRCRLKGMFRLSTANDEGKYGSKKNFEDAVQDEPDKRMDATETNGLKILYEFTAALQTVGFEKLGTMNRDCTGPFDFAGPSAGDLSIYE